MSYIIPIGNGSYASAINGWFCVSNAVTRESLGYYSWIMVGYQILGYLTNSPPIDKKNRKVHKMCARYLKILIKSLDKG